MVLKTYYDFSNPGSYGGLQRLQKATGVPVKKLKSIMQWRLICLTGSKNGFLQVPAATRESKRHRKHNATAATNGFFHAQ